MRAATEKNTRKRYVTCNIAVKSFSDWLDPDLKCVMIIARTWLASLAVQIPTPYVD